MKSENSADQSPTDSASVSVSGRQKDVGLTLKFKARDPLSVPLEDSTRFYHTVSFKASFWGSSGGPCSYIHVYPSGTCARVHTV